MHNSRESGKIFLVKTSPENAALKRAYNKSFAARTKTIRERSGIAAEEVANFLDVKLDTYYRYESKVAMPHYLIGRFLAITGGDAGYLMGVSLSRKPTKLRPVK